MKKWLLLVLAVIPIILVGCVPPVAPAAAPAVVSPITDLQNWRTAMDTWKQTVADPAIAKINTQGQSTDLQNQLASEKATITQLRTDLDAAVTRLTSAENSIKTLSAGTVVNQQINPGQSGYATQFTPGTPPTGIVTTLGVVTQQVNFVQGSSQTFTSPSGTSNNLWYVQRLINQSPTIQYVRPTISLSVSSQYGGVQQSYFAGLNINISSAQGTVQGVYLPPQWWINNPASVTGGFPISSITATSPIQTGNTTFNTPIGVATFSLAPGLGQVTNSLYIIPTSGLGNNLGEYYISPGGYVDATVMVQGLYTSTALMWNISPSFSSHP
jgi:hypothetical protein